MIPVLVLCVALEFLFVPLFLKYCWPKKTRKSLMLKMVCSSLFVVVGILAVQIKGENSIYARWLLLGLCAGWLGDFMLHVYPHRMFQLMGLSSFLLGHVFYTVGFSNAIAKIFPRSKFFDPLEVAGFCVLVLGLAAFLAVGKAHFSATTIAIVLYAVTIFIMIIKAWSLGVQMVYNGMRAAYAAQLLLCTGSVLFLFSDSLLALIEFKNFKSFRVKAVNIGTYYSAQLAIASTILFIPA